MNHPNVVAHPVLIFLGSLLTAFALDWSWPVGMRDTELGVLLLMLGVGFIAWAIATMRQAGTEVDPYRTPSRLVVVGPYKYTRNPIYLGWAPALMGIGLLFGTWWTLILLPATYGIIHYGVVKREETFLRAMFGDDYDNYCLRVRRWL